MERILQARVKTLEKENAALQTRVETLEMKKRWRSTWLQGASRLHRMPILRHVCPPLARPRKLHLLWLSRRGRRRARSHFVHIAPYTHLGRALLVLDAELHPGCRAAWIRPSGPRVVGGGRSCGRVRTWLARHSRLTAIRMLPGRHTLLGTCACRNVCLCMSV